MVAPAPCQVGLWLCTEPPKYSRERQLRDAGLAAVPPVAVATPLQARLAWHLDFPTAVVIPPEPSGCAGSVSGGSFEAARMVPLRRQVVLMIPSLHVLAQTSSAAPGQEEAAHVK